MSLSPKALAARDQLEAAIRDRFDEHGINIHADHDRLTILCVVGLIADAAMAFKGSELDTPERRVKGISYALESIVNVIEASA